jgi:hypothetical protein
MGSMKRVALVAALVLACGSENDWPDVEGLYRIGSDPVCEQAAAEWSDEDGHHCSWERVKVDGQPRCWAIVDFAQEGGVWTVARTWTTSASCD